MRTASYHALAEVHHEAKASVYEGAGLYEKARKHWRRAARHAFGAGDEEYKPWREHDPVDSPLEYDAYLLGAQREWDPDTADPESDKYDPHSQYVQMLDEVRKSGSFAPSGDVGSRGNPIELDAEEYDAEKRREGYRSRARRAEEGMRARRELKEIARDTYENLLDTKHSGHLRNRSHSGTDSRRHNWSALFNRDLKRRLDADVYDGVGGTYVADRTLRGIQRRAWMPG